MKPYRSSQQWQILLAWVFLSAPLAAQNPYWPIVPQSLHFNTAGSTGTIMPGSYTTPYFASNSAQDAAGNVMFYVVNENIYDNTGALIGSTGPSWGSNGKDIAIVPDPADCQARIILSGYVDIIVGGGSSYYEWRVYGTRVSKSGSVWTVQPNYFSYTIGGCDNAYMSMAVRKPNSAGERMWYVVVSRGVYRFQIASSGISYVSDVQAPGEFFPTDADLSPSGDKLIWSDYIYELKWYNLDVSNGNMLSYGWRPIDYTGAYYASGVEFADNNNVWVSAIKTSGLSGGIYQCTFGNPVAAQVSTNIDYGKSQLERALDGKIYAASATNLWGKNPSTGLSATISVPAYSNYFQNSASYAYYALPEQLDYEDYGLVFGCGCLSDVTITGSYSVPLTESQTWVKTLGTCFIPANTTVKLDADPINGYVDINPGFTANGFQNVVFVAQAFNGCAPGAPLGLQPEVRNEPRQEAQSLWEKTAFRLFPNPVSQRAGICTLESSEALQTDVRVEVMDLTGRVLTTSTLRSGESSQNLSFEACPSGIYVVRASTQGKLIWAGKVVKE